MTAPDAHRSVSLERLAEGSYVARNARGGELRVDSAGGEDFTPVELLLVALAGCSAVDVDVATGRRAQPTTFTVRADGQKVVEDGAGILRDLTVTFSVTFPDGPGGDAARQVLPRALRVAHERTCTVSRTVEAGVPVRMVVDGA